MNTELNSIKGKKVLVIGDVMLDTYHQTIKDFYDRYYQPAYDSNLRRTLAMGRNFKLKKNN